MTNKCNHSVLHLTLLIWCHGLVRPLVILFGQQKLLASGNSVSDVTHSQIGSMGEGAEEVGHIMPKSSFESPGVEDQQSTQEQAVVMANNEDVSGDVPTCIECEDQHAELVCLSCEEPFCRPCWGSLHR